MALWPPDSSWYSAVVTSLNKGKKCNPFCIVQHTKRGQLHIDFSSPLHVPCLKELTQFPLICFTVPPSPQKQKQKIKHNPECPYHVVYRF